MEVPPAAIIITHPTAYHRLASPRKATQVQIMIREMTNEIWMAFRLRGNVCRRRLSSLTLISIWVGRRRLGCRLRMGMMGFGESGEALRLIGQLELIGLHCKQTEMETQPKPKLKGTETDK
jgi:hypothetical protein